MAMIAGSALMYAVTVLVAALSRKRIPKADVATA